MPFVLGDHGVELEISTSQSILGLPNQKTAEFAV
jgi:hypothetical protein